MKLAIYDIYREFLLLFYCCVLLEIKLTTTTIFLQKVHYDSECPSTIWFNEIQPKNCGHISQVPMD